MNQGESSPAPASQQQRQPQLNIVAEKTLPKKCKLDILAYCPTMDLVALATDDEELHVFRLSGQRVLGVNFAGDDAFDYGYSGGGEDEEEEKGEVRCVAWKRNGEFIRYFSWRALILGF
jgi:anaphase-promoting complex subunit 4